LVVPRTIRPKKMCTCIIHLWCNVLDHLAELFIFTESCSYFLVRWAVCCYKATNSLDWVLDTDWELPTVETLWAARKFSVVVLESPYTRFYRVHQIILPPSTNPERNLDGSKDRPHISPSTGYCRSPENEKEIIIFNSRKIITYKIKWLNEHSTKCWARLSTNCCTPFWQSSIRTCVSTNNSMGLGSCPRDVVYKKK
jgi:hypothetical protein